MAGLEVRPLEETDVAVCQELYREVNGHARDGETHMAAKRALAWLTPYVVVDRADGRVAGHASGLSDLGHAVTTSEAALRALCAGADELLRRTAPDGPAPVLRIPGRPFPQATLHWALRNRGLTLVRLETLITRGSYTSPDEEVYCPGPSY